MGMYGMANALANALAPSLSVTVWQNFGYRTALLMSALYAVITALLLSFVKDKGEPTPVQNSA